MKFHFVCWLCFWQAAALSATAQESPHPSSSKPAPQVAQASATKMPQPGPEMLKLMAFLGRWIYHFEYEPSEGSPTRRTSEGKAVFRAGPGGLSLIEDEVEEAEAGKMTSGHSVTWWDEKAHGYRAIWCDSKNPNGCTLMSHLAKWEGDQFVLGDDFMKDGKKYVLKEVVSAITSTSFTLTLSQGEAGKELKRVVTILAVKANQSSITPTPKSK